MATAQQSTSPSPVCAGVTLLALFSTVAAAAAAAPRIDISDRRIEIHGEGWTLRYGTISALEKRFVVASEDRAWLAHESWLRLIDTGTGTVIGRWRFPGLIVDLTPSGTKLELTFQWGRYSATESERTTWTFDPDHPDVPNWPGEGGWPTKVSEYEPGFVAGLYPLEGDPALSPEEARAVLLQLESAIRCDPWSPWLQFALGKLLRETKDPRAPSVLEGAIAVPSTDYTEWFPLSAALERMGERNLAREAFERGYRDFIERGNEPRLFLSLFSRAGLYSLSRNEWEGLAPDHHEELVDRLYRFAPHAQGADIAWQHFADSLEPRGRPRAAALWAARAREAREGSWDWPYRRIVVLLDRSVLWVRASLGAAALFVIALFARSFERQPQCSFLAMSSWSRAERVAFTTIVAAGWVAVGALGEIREVVTRRSAPFEVAAGGSLGGAPNIAYFEKLPSTPERDLLLATAYHQSGMLAEAERLYRVVPEFPESWNNLGAVLIVTGREAEARQAFEKALDLDPDLSEAKWNLSSVAQDEWTEVHQRFCPSSPMLTPPRAERLHRARLAGSEWQMLLRALAGPFASPYERSDDLSLSHLWRRGLADAKILFAAMALVCLVLFLVPYRGESPEPGGRYWLWEVLVPGTSRRWTCLGGLVLVAWCYLLLQAAYHLLLGTPYATLSESLPGLANSYGTYGVPMASSNPLQHFHPPGFWLFGAPILLFVLNGLLVWRARGTRGASI